MALAASAGIKLGRRGVLLGKRSIASGHSQRRHYQCAHPGNPPQVYRSLDAGPFEAVGTTAAICRTTPNHLIRPRAAQASKKEPQSTVSRSLSGRATANRPFVRALAVEPNGVRKKYLPGSCGIVHFQHPGKKLAAFLNLPSLWER